MDVSARHTEEVYMKSTMTDIRFCNLRPYVCDGSLKCEFKDITVKTPRELAEIARQYAGDCSLVRDYIRLYDGTLDPDEAIALSSFIGNVGCFLGILSFEHIAKTDGFVSE